MEASKLYPKYNFNRIRLDVREPDKLGKNNEVFISRQYHNELGYLEGNENKVGMVIGSEILIRDLKIDDGLRYQEIRLGLADYQKAGQYIELFKPHNLLLEEYLLSSRLLRIKKKLLVLISMIHIEGKDFDLNSLIDTCTRFGHRLDLNIDSGEVEQLAGELHTEQRFKLVYKGIFHFYKLRHHNADFLLEIVLSELEGSCISNERYDLLEEYRQTRSAWQYFVRKLLLFYVYVHRYGSFRPYDFKHCLPDAYQRSKDYLGEQVELNLQAYREYWMQMGSIRAEFIAILGNMQKIALEKKFESVLEART